MTKFQLIETNKLFKVVSHIKRHSYTIPKCIMLVDETLARTQIPINVRVYVRT